MCGIFAYIGKDHSEEELQSHYITTQHRGPDDSTSLQIMPPAQSRDERHQIRLKYEEEIFRDSQPCGDNKDKDKDNCEEECEVFDPSTVAKESIQFVDDKQVIFGFHRLKINGLDEASNQPLEHEGVYLICNGEIYNHKQLEQREGFRMKTNSDCEVILHLYKRFGIRATVNKLDGVFAFVLYDTNTANLYVVRDPIGVRPVFIGKIEHNFTPEELEAKKRLEAKREAEGSDGEEDLTLEEEVAALPDTFHDSYIFSSELKACSLCSHVDQFPPGNIWSPDHGFECYWGPNPRPSTMFGPRRMRLLALQRLFVEGVTKRLMSDRPVGLLLSGGLDSSLVAALVKQYIDKNNGNPTLGTFPDHLLHSFSIGTKESPDLIAAQKVADYLGTTHHVVNFTPEEGIAAIPEVIKALETYDITTIRASTPMYLLSKYIAEQTDIRVILSGEGSDEIFGGYLYFHSAFTAAEFQTETQRLVANLHKYDVLRSDRSTAAHGLEVRVPFLDKEFVNMVLSTDPKEKYCHKSENTHRMHRATATPKVSDEKVIEGRRIEKKLLREIFDMDDQVTKKPLLPADVLWRAKDGMSDAVGYNWVDSLLAHTNELITDKQLNKARQRWTHNTPKTKEAYWYRQIFEDLYPNRSHVLDEMWLPKWSGDHHDPSARKLSHFNSVSEEARL